MADVNAGDIGGAVGNLFGGLLGVKRQLDENGRYNEDRKLRERALQMDAARYGLLQGDDGEYSMSPEAEEQKQFKQRMLNMGLEKNSLELE